MRPLLPRLRRALPPLVLLAAACGGDRRTPPPDAGPDGRYQRYAAVQVGAFGSRGAAERLADSLRSAGWLVHLQPSDTGPDARWRVQVSPTHQLAHVELVAHALRRQLGPDGARVVHDSARVVTDPVTGFTRVNYGPQGMAARVRWALPEDRRTLLVVEDATSVENEAMPNGFVFATEVVPQLIQMDSVWDVAPDVSWRRVAYGRAHVLRGGEADTLPTAMWRALADTLGTSVREVRAASFPASGMAIMFGISRLGMVAFADSAGVGRAPRHRFPVLAGWRVRWTRGNDILAGMAPVRVQDDAPATRWVRVDPSTERSVDVDTTDTAALDTLDAGWIQGPTIDISVPPDTATQVTVPIDGGTLESRHGWIRLDGRILAPGVLLTATRTGRYIAALVPNPSAKEYESEWMLGVYVTERTGGR